jgi:hypothetical protein
MERIKLRLAGFFGRWQLDHALVDRAMHGCVEQARSLVPAPNGGNGLGWASHTPVKRKPS